MRRPVPSPRACNRGDFPAATTRRGAWTEERRGLGGEGATSLSLSKGAWRTTASVESRAVCFEFHLRHCRPRGACRFHQSSSETSCDPWLHRVQVRNRAESGELLRAPGWLRMMQVTVPLGRARLIADLTHEPPTDRWRRGFPGRRGLIPGLSRGLAEMDLPGDDVHRRIPGASRNGPHHPDPDRLSSDRPSPRT